MARINPDWLSSHRGSPYPVSDTATRVSDAGETLPNDLLADLHVSWPDDYGQHLFVAAMTVRPSVVSIVLAAGETPTTTTITPVASFSSPAGLVVPGQAQRLTPLIDGAGGFVTFGDLSETWTGMFSTPLQSLVLARCTYPYARSGVLSVRKIRRQVGLTGIVSLKAGNDLTITRQTLLIDGDDREAIVFGLKSGNPDRNVFEVYAPTCGGRPESGTCGAEAVQTIGGAAPDCSGNIEIQLVGPTPIPLTLDDTARGLVIQDSVGIEEVCFEATPDTLEGVGDCVFSSLGGDDLGSLDSLACQELPYDETFADSDAGFTEILSGDYDILTDGFGTKYFGATDVTRRCLARALHCGGCYQIRATIWGLISGSAAYEQFGLLLNHKEQSGETRYHAVVVDKERQQIRFLRYDGSDLIQESATNLVQDIGYNTKYQLVVTVTGTYGAPTLTAYLTSLSGGYIGTTATHTALNFGIADGYCGYYADRSYTRFYRLRVEEEP